MSPITARRRHHGGAAGYGSSVLRLEALESRVLLSSAPVLAAQELVLLADPAPGTLIGQVQASDADGDPLQFSILAGNAGQALAIDPASGVLSVLNPAALTPAGSAMELLVQVTDGNGHNASAIVTLNLPAQSTQRITQGLGGLPTDGPSGYFSDSYPNIIVSDVNQDGRFVVFESFASNLNTDDTNNAYDIYLHDRDTQQTHRISVSGNGGQANDGSYYPSLSDDGRHVAFASDASNLVDGDFNFVRDIFVYDRQAQTLQRVSVSGAGVAGNGDSDRPRISGDGRFVVYESDASNLVPGDNNDATDIFVYDRQTQTTQRVSVSTDGEQADDRSVNASISDDGRFIAYESLAGNLVTDDHNFVVDVFLFDRQTQVTQRVSMQVTGRELRKSSLAPAVSGDGRYVAFHSAAANIVPDQTTGTDGVYVFDRIDQTTQRVSLELDGGEHAFDSVMPDLSDDGRYVAYQSLGGAYVFDRLNDTTQRVAADAWGVTMSDDGQVVLFSSASSDLPGVAGPYQDVFVTRRGLDNDQPLVQDQAFAMSADLQQGQSIGSVRAGDSDPADTLSFAITAGNEDAVVAIDGASGLLTVADAQALLELGSLTLTVEVSDGHAAAVAQVRVQVQSRPIERLSVNEQGQQAGGNSALLSNSALSADGRYVVFASNAPNLTPDDTNNHFDVFVQDRQEGTIQRVSVSMAGEQGNDASGLNGVSISDDGRFVAFSSMASNLVPGDNNDARDIFLLDRQTGDLLCVTQDADAGSYEPALSGDGRFLTFSSYASTLVPQDTNFLLDIFVFDRISASMDRVSVGSDGTQADGDSEFPVISADGRYVAFSSWASNLSAGDTNDAYDVFLYDRQNQTVERISLTSQGVEPGYSGYASISDDGRFVGFSTTGLESPAAADEMQGIYILDRQTQTLQWLDSGYSNVSFSLDHQRVAWSSDSGPIHVMDRVSGQLDVIDALPLDYQWGAPHLDGAGQAVVFVSDLDSLVPHDTNQRSDLFVAPVQLDATRIVVEDQSMALFSNPSTNAVVGRVQAQVSAGQPVFSIVDGNDGNAFAINASTGVITVKTPSSIQNHGQEPYDLTVRVAVGADSATASVAISTGKHRFGMVDGRPVKLTLFNPETGFRVIYSLKGNGTGHVLVDSTTGSFDIILNGSDAKTALKIVAQNTDGSVAVMRNLVVAGNGALGSLDARNTQLSGQLKVPKGVKSIALHSASDAAMTIGAADGASDALSLRMVWAQNLSIDSAMPIKSFTAQTWIDDDWVPDRLKAPSLKSMKISGIAPGDGLAADLVLTSTLPTALGSVSVAGDIQDSNWSIAGGAKSVTARSWSSGSLLAQNLSTLRIEQNLGINLTLTTGSGVALGSARIGGAITRGQWSVSADLGALSVGNVTGNWQCSGGVLKSLTSRGGLAGVLSLQSAGSISAAGDAQGWVLRSAGNVGAINLRSLIDSKILLGVEGNPVTLPDSADAFDNLQATLGSLTITGAGDSFRNSRVMAALVGNVKLTQVQVDNADIVLGFAAQQIQLMTLLDGQQPMVLRELQATEDSQSLGDFELRILS